MTVEHCTNAEAWDAYVAQAPHASNYHRWIWPQVIRSTYGHEPYYLAAVENGVLRGILPLVWMKSRIFGDFLVSVPFFSYGGVVADSPAATEALLEEAVRLARDLRARHVELRQCTDCDTGWQSVATKVTMEVDLPATADEMFGRLSPKMRKRIRYAAKHGLEARWGGPEAVGDFYSVFATNMRNLGTPVYPKAWFDNICRAVAGGIRILTLWDGGRPAATAYVSAFRDTLELPWAASTPESREKFSPLLLYWTLLEWAQANGFRRVDLGRCTPGGGNYDFKRRWLPNEKPLKWHYWLSPGHPLPELRPESARYRWAVKAWKHLPLPIANSIGPRLVRSIP